MNRIKRNIHLLHILSSASPSQRKAILKTASDDQIKSLCEICQNFLLGNIPNVCVKKLKSHKNLIRKLANKNVSIPKKRKIFSNQTGGFLPLILKGVLSLLSEITS